MVKPLAFKIIWDRKALDHFKEILSYLEKQSSQAPKIVKMAIFVIFMQKITTNAIFCIFYAKICMHAKIIKHA